MARIKFIPRTWVHRFMKGMSADDISLPTKNDIAKESIEYKVDKYIAGLSIDDEDDIKDIRLGFWRVVQFDAHLDAAAWILFSAKKLERYQMILLRSVKTACLQHFFGVKVWSKFHIRIEKILDLGISWSPTVAALTWRRQGKTASMIVAIGIMLMIMRDRNYYIGLVPNIVSSALELVMELEKLLEGFKKMFPSVYGNCKIKINRMEHRLTIKHSTGFESRLTWTSRDKHSGRGKKWDFVISDETEFADQQAIENSVLAIMGQGWSVQCFISTINTALPEEESIIRRVISTRESGTGKPSAINASLATFCEKHAHLRFEGHFCCPCKRPDISPRINPHNAENVVKNFFGDGTRAAAEMFGLMDDVEDMYFDMNMVNKFKQMNTRQALSANSVIGNKAEVYIFTGMDPSGGAGLMAVIHLLVCRYAVTSADGREKLDAQNETRSGFKIMYVIIGGGYSTWRTHYEVPEFVVKVYDSLFATFPPLLEAKSKVKFILAVEGNMRSSASMMKFAACETVRKKYGVNIVDPYSDPEHKHIGIYTTKQTKQMFVDRIGTFIKSGQLVFNKFLGCYPVDAEEFRKEFCEQLIRMKLRVKNGTPKIEGHKVDLLSALWIALQGVAISNTTEHLKNRGVIASRFY